MLANAFCVLSWDVEVEQAVKDFTSQVSLIALINKVKINSLTFSRF
jgi:hypothetical protein